MINESYVQIKSFNEKEKDFIIKTEKLVIELSKMHQEFKDLEISKQETERQLKLKEEEANGLDGLIKIKTLMIQEQFATITNLTEEIEKYKDTQSGLESRVSESGLKIISLLGNLKDNKVVIEQLASIIDNLNVEIKKHQSTLEQNSKMFLKDMHDNGQKIKTEEQQLALDIEAEICETYEKRE